MSSATRTKTLKEQLSELSDVTRDRRDKRITKQMDETFANVMKKKRVKKPVKANKIRVYG